MGVAPFLTALLLAVSPVQFVQAHVAAHPELMAIPGKERAAAHT